MYDCLVDSCVQVREIQRARSDKMKKYIILGILFLVSLSVKTGAHHDVRWVPDKWCGHGPPYSGTLWIGSTYGVPFNWIEVGRYEKCTTITSLIPDFSVYPAGLMLNIMSFGAIGLILKHIPNCARKG